MELRLKRNSDIIEGRARAYELIEENITSHGSDGEPLLVRYRDDSGRIRTIIVMIGPDGNYSTFEDSNGGGSGGNTTITSEDGSVRVNETATGYDLGVLSPEIIEYLSNLTEYKYTFSVSIVATSIDIETSSECTGRANISSSKTRGLDGGSTSVAIASSTSSSDGWAKNGENQWVYRHTVTDPTIITCIRPFSASVTNADGKTGTVSGQYKITYLKPWYIIEHGEETPTAAEINEYIDKVKTADLKGSGDKTKKATTWNQTTDNYFWILAPKNKKATATQLGDSVILDGVEVSGTKYGVYTAYRSKSKQAAGSTPSPDILIQ